MDLNPYAVDLSARLKGVLGVPVDVNVLNDAPLPFRRHVFAEGVPLMSVDEERRLRTLDETLRRYCDVEMLNRAATAECVGDRHVDAGE